MHQTVKNIVEMKLDNFMEESDLKSKDDAFMYYMYALFNNTEFEEINVTDIIKSKCIVDGGQDKQIDAISILENDEEKEAIIRVFQMKKTGGFKSNIIVQMKNGLEWILDRPEIEIKRNSNIKFVSKIKEVREVVKKYSLGSIGLEIYYITLGNIKDINQNDEFFQELDAFTARYESLRFRNFDFFIIGAKEILDQINLIEMKNKKVNEKIKLIYDINTPSLILRKNNDLQSVICSVKAEEIARLVKQDQNDVLFDKNIRKYLEKRGKVNQSILEACTKEEDSELFWCLNNGITMICDKFSIDSVGGEAVVTVDNLQIINGCQTSVTLYTAMKKGVLKGSTEVLVKIHATLDKDIVEKITIATNNQNPINHRDLRANDDIQIAIQTFINEKYGFYYERKRNEYRGLSKIERNKIIVNEKMGQAFLGVGLRKPNRSLGSKSDVFTKEYDNIYNGNIYHLVFSYLLYKYVERRKKELDEEGLNEIKLGVVSYGTFHISRVLASVLFGEDRFPNDGDLDNIIRKMINNELDLTTHYNIAVNEIEKEISKKKSEELLVVNYLKRLESSKLMNKIVKSNLAQITI